MELKSFLSKLNEDKETPQETFLAIEIASETVKSAVWTVEEKKTAVLKTGSIEEWEEENEESLIEAIDTSISNASEGIKPEPDRTIFGLPESWVKGEEILAEKKEFLKKLSTKLELKPLGFVVILEALTTFLKDKEGVPVSAIFINLSESQVIVSLIHLGKIKGSQKVGRSDDLAADVREGLARLGKIEELPSRMILFNGVANFEEAKQQLVSFDWQEELPFLHFPQVEVLEALTPVKAVALAGGAEVAKSLGFKIEAKKKEEKETEEEGTKAVDLGFVEGKDIAEETIKTEEERPLVERKVEEEKIEEKAKEEVKKEKKASAFLKIIVQKLTGFFSLFTKIPLRRPRLLKNKIPSLIIFFILPFIILVSAGWAFYWYIPKATISLYFEPKVIEKELSLTVDAEAREVDKEEGIIPGNLKPIEIEGSKTKETTGEKLVGDKAKGEVVIYNKTDASEVFSSGTVLIGPDNLSFTLDEEVTVASKSAEETDEGEQVTYGKATAAITAASIGTESNLSSQAQLSFKEYSTSLYSAKTEEGLSGGTSRQIRAVSEQDLSSLLEELTDQLASQAYQEIEKKIGSQEAVLNKEAEREVLNKKYSAEEDEEADSLSLDLKTKFTFLVYEEKNLEQILTQEISPDFPSGFSFNFQKKEIDIEEITLTEEKAHVKAKVKLSLLPQVEEEKIKENIKGRYPQVVEEYLKNLPNFSRAEIKISPPLPAKLRTLPRIIKNIKLEVKIEEE